ncbi:unnamed protein product [Urochloa humidicola]
MGYSKMFYFPWLADDGPGDTCLADLDNKNQQQQQPAANLTQEQELFSNAYPSAPKIILNGKDGGVDGDAWEALLLTAAQMESLTSLLANATTPEQQRLILGERLYPLVQQLEPYQAPKVTGMLLELDQTEILHLLVSPEALKSRVAEAMTVLWKAYFSAPKIIHNTEKQGGERGSREVVKPRERMRSPR